MPLVQFDDIIIKYKILLATLTLTIRLPRFDHANCDSSGICVAVADEESLSKVWEKYTHILNENESKKKSNTYGNRKLQGLIDECLIIIIVYEKNKQKINARKFARNTNFALKEEKFENCEKKLLILSYAHTLQYSYLL